MYGSIESISFFPDFSDYQESDTWNRYIRFSAFWFIKSWETSIEALVKESKPVVTQICWSEKRDESIFIPLVGFSGLSGFC